MKILPILLAALLATTAATSPARADISTDIKLLRKFDAVLKKEDVVGERRLVAAPNFRPLLAAGQGQPTIFERVLDDEQVAIARLMMRSAGWKKTKWNAVNTRRPLYLASLRASLLPILQDLARQPAFRLNAPCTDDGATPLHCAASVGNLAALKWLTRQPKVDLNACNLKGETALFGADTTAMAYLVKLPEIELNACDKEGGTALIWETSNGLVEQMRVLLAAPGVDANLKDNHGKTALDYALSLEDGTAARLLMGSAKVKPTAAQREQFDAPRSGWTDAPASTTTPYPDQPEPLQMNVAQKRWKEIIDTGDVAGARRAVKDAKFDPLLRMPAAGTSDFALESGLTALSYALWCGQSDIAIAMMEAAPDASYVKSTAGLGNLELPANLPVVQWLLRQPAFDPNRTGLIFGLASMNNLEGIKLLMADARLDPGARDTQNKTVLFTLAGTHWGDPKRRSRWDSTGGGDQKIRRQRRRKSRGRRLDYRRDGPKMARPARRGRPRSRRSDAAGIVVVDQRDCQRIENDRGRFGWSRSRPVAGD